MKAPAESGGRQVIETTSGRVGNSLLAEPAELVRAATNHSLRFVLTGHVQGVGFRPFVYRLAKRYGLTGQVQNRLGEVEILACGSSKSLQLFEVDLVNDAPPLSRPTVDSVQAHEKTDFDAFEIVTSSAQANARVFVPPDYFMCDDCREELKDPSDRRFRYPFINCTQCGPRYTLIESLPYDRPNTSMAEFPLCDACEQEYLDPVNRRFHAEPVACPDCGPQLQFVDAQRKQTASAETALEAALDNLRAGAVVAVKGIGGYHLMCDARDAKAIDLLRQRKHRPDKPLAVMFPFVGDDGLDMVRKHACLDAAEAALLTSPARPIVLATRLESSDLADNIASGLGEIGAFLPYSPLHELLLDGFKAPLVATSANVSGEPVLTDNREVESRLGDVADVFLHHDRPIVRPADDPVYRRIAGSMRPLRLGRGCAPFEFELPWQQPQPLLAVGGHMKGTLALSWDDRVVVSPHIGEMDNPRSLSVFEQVAKDLQALYGVTAERIACDAHSGYTTHRWAKTQALPVEIVFHHSAHASALAAEFALAGRWLVFTWDGVGLGEDHTLWGGEALLGEAGNWRRVASLRPFRLPGGEKAGREPWRSAAALHWTCNKEWPDNDSPDKDGLAKIAWQKDLNCPETSAAGRLFDAAAALICEVPFTSFEAQGPMMLESLCKSSAKGIELPLAKDKDGTWRSDWEPLLNVIDDRTRSKTSRADIFHSSFAHALLQQARAIRDECSVDQVGLCGGVFQNRVLAELAIKLLEGEGFRVYLPSALPCNDAALSFGQAAELAARGHNG
jgi:hydrogenase maturation protein HypF